MILYCIVTAFLNAFGAVLLGISVLLRGPGRRENHIFAWFTVSFAAWSVFYLLWQLSTTEADALFYARALAGASIFIPVTYFHFISRLTARNEMGEIIVGYSLAFVVALFAFTSYLVREVSPAMSFPYWPKAGPVFWLYLAVFLYFVARAGVCQLQAMRRATHWRRKQLIYVCCGTAIGWAGGFTNFPLWLDIPIPPFGNGFALIYIVTVGYAVTRFRLVELHEFVVRGLLYLMLVAAIAATYLLAASVLQYAVPAEMPDLILISEYVAAFLVTLGVVLGLPKIRRQIDLLLEEKALGGLADERNRLREHIHRISTISGLDAIFEETVTVVSEALRGARVEIYCRNEFEGDYGRQAGTVKEQSFFGRRLSDEDWLVRVARLSGKEVVVYEREKTVDSADGIAECDRVGVELAIPIHADRVFYGLLLCGPRGDRRLYSDLDISLLETACIQIGLTIRSRELERRTNRTENLISLGTLAAGLAHELRNPLVSIRTFTELIGEQGGDPEFRKQFSTIVERDVKRIGAIIEQVAVFAKNAGSNFAPVDLLRVIHDVHDIAREELAEAGVTFTFRQTPIPLVRGNYSQLIQVFLNLLQNAVQALQDSSSPTIQVSFMIRRSKAGSESIVVVVADNGPGIPPGIRQRIFDPFVTTKNTGSRETHRGMGLGLGIVKCIVEAHGGTVDLATTSTSGTTFYVELPCHASNNGVVPDEKRQQAGAIGISTGSGSLTRGESTAKGEP